MTRILLVDDDDIFITSVRKNLESIGYKVITAENGKVGYEKFLNSKVDLVITDIRMPELDGIGLLQKIREISSKPVIMITGFSEIIEAKEAHRLGADEFLTKPFERVDLVAAIKRCLESVETHVDTDSEPEPLTYYKVGVEDFISGRQIPYAIYIKISPTKYIKVAHVGEDLSIERIKDYKNHGVNYLYLLKDDFHKYVGFTVTISKAVHGNNSISMAKKLNLIRHTGEILLKQIARDGVDNELFNSSANFVETVTEVLAADTEVLEILDALNHHTNYLYAHSVGTSLYSVMMAHAVNWKLATNKFKVAASGLLHDVGQKEIEVEVLSKPRARWTVDEVKLYESHPIRSTQILSGLESISSDIVQIIHEHHEDCLSQGFPSRLKKNIIHPMAKLVSVANEFCRRVVKNPHHPQMHPHEALAQMTLLSTDRLDPVFLKALMEIFKYEIPEKPKKCNMFNSETAQQNLDAPNRLYLKAF